MSQFYLALLIGFFFGTLASVGVVGLMHIFREGK